MNKPCCVPGEMLCNKCMEALDIEEEEPVTIRNPPKTNPLDTSYVQVYGQRISSLPSVSCPPRVMK